MKIAIHTKIDSKPNKGDTKAYASLANEFKNVDITVEELAAHIAQGHSFCAQHKGQRTSANFICSDVIAVDIDNGMTLRDAVNLPFVQTYAAIVYRTWSHTNAANRFRIVFATPRSIIDAEEMKFAYQGLIKMFGGDKACKDACRIFFGSKNFKPYVLGNVLSNEVLDDLIERGSRKKISAEAGEDGRSSPGTSALRSQKSISFDQTAKTVDGSTQKIVDMERQTRVHCPYHFDKHPSAFVTESRSGTKGIHCCVCDETFWPPTIDYHGLQNYDFYKIDSDLNALEYEEDPEHLLWKGTPEGFYSTESRVVKTGSGKRLSDISFRKGITLVRSPKGSGKTWQLKNIVRCCKNLELSVLLIGHRQSLISALAKELGLDCYLDKTDLWGNPILVSDYYAICLDSIPRLLNLNAHKFDVIIIDESEQVFSHLTSDTLRVQRRECFLKLERYLQQAQAVIACDADLSYLTVATIAAARDGEMPTQFYVNRHKEVNREIEIFDSENHLLCELIFAANRGGRHYVCCNSKTKAQVIAKALDKAKTRELRIKLITSDNSQDDDVRKFIENIKTEILNYDVIVSSPSLGTGIDISFKEDAQEIDGVYGFFISRINTHFDIDQQLCRVRNPTFVKAWISPERFSFETEHDVIMRNCIDSGKITDAQISFDENNQKVYAPDDKLVALYAEVLSLNRASKNNLRKHFIALKTYNGWTVNLVATEQEKSVIGRTIAKSIKSANEQEYIALTCDAEKISRDVAKSLMKAPQRKPSEQAQIDKHLIEGFYDETITPHLVALDDHGKYRKKIRLMAVLQTHEIVLMDKDMAQENHALTDRSHSLLKNRILREIFTSAGLMDARGELLVEERVCDSEMNEFKQICYDRKNDIESLLKMPLRNDWATRPVRQLGEFLRAIGCEWDKPTKSDIHGKRVVHYQMNRDSYDESVKYARNLIDRGPKTVSFKWNEDTDEVSLRFNRNGRRVPQSR